MPPANVCPTPVFGQGLPPIFPADQGLPPIFADNPDASAGPDDGSPKLPAAWRDSTQPYDAAVLSLAEALEATTGLAEQARRRLFQDMVKMWHPDKNENLEATQVFQWLMSEKCNYLGYETTPQTTPR